MLSPNRGEGEHSKNYNKKKKAPQIALAVLLFSTPVCMAEAATSSFGISPELRLSQQEQRQGLLHRGYNFPSQTQQTKFASATPIITESDISALETTLAQYKTKLSSLPSEATDPDLQPDLDKIGRAHV